MPIVYTKEGWKVENPTDEEVVDLIEKGKEAIVRASSLQQLKQREFLEKLTDEQFFNS